MKNFTAVLVLAALAGMLMFSGCAHLSVLNQSPSTGMLYTDCSAPLPIAAANYDAATASKIGTATTTSILGWFATGNASIDAAMKNGGISKIHHVDFHVNHILGLYAQYTITVYGE